MLRSGALSEGYDGEEAWPVQFVVSTHSSHIANAASFEAVRYFLSSPATSSAERHTKVKDFRKGSADIDPADREFLHQYMTLTKCDLYFADKAILVEGATERILMPKFVLKVDDGFPADKRLGNQYLTIIEVGGAYAHVFYQLLDFLELKSLVITDLDATYLDKSKSPNRWKKCPTSEGTRTSNPALRRWFGIDEGDKVTLDDLVKMPDARKLAGFRRIAYQVPEEGLTVCARSYEDALILANLEMFDLTDGDLGIQSWEKAKGFSKADEALRFAIQETSWSVPRYIREGLVWLAEPPPPRDSLEAGIPEKAVTA
jgi:putative ATP-dependent endonuclease of the OLD family